MVRPLLIVFAVCAAVALAAGIGAAALYKPVPHAKSTKPDPIQTRDFAWDGGARLEVALDAHVTYTQGPVAKLTITGPKSRLDNIEVRGGVIRYKPQFNSFSISWSFSDDSRTDASQDLQIVMTAPAVQSFTLSGDADLTVLSFNQPRLNLDITGDGRIITSAAGAKSVEADISGDGKAELTDLTADTARFDITGDGEITAAGQATRLTASISGSGKTNLGKLKVQDAKLDITGDGISDIAPTGEVDIDISGDGKVNLLSHPSKMTSNVSGSGQVNQLDAKRAPA